MDNVSLCWRLDDQVSFALWETLDSMLRWRPLLDGGNPMGSDACQPWLEIEAWFAKQLGSKHEGHPLLVGRIYSDQSLPTRAGSRLVSFKQAVVHSERILLGNGYD